MVEIPQRIIDGMNRLREKFVSKLGFETFADKFQDPGEPSDTWEICVFNPIRNFNGVELPEMRACLNLGELSREAWVLPLRIVLLFVITTLFFSAMVVVFRQA